MRIFVVVSKPGEHRAVISAVYAVDDWFNWYFSPLPVKFITVVSLRSDTVNVASLSYVSAVAGSTGW